MNSPLEHTYNAVFWSSRIKNVAPGVKKDVFETIARFSPEQWYIDE